MLISAAAETTNSGVADSKQGNLSKVLQTSHLEQGLVWKLEKQKVALVLGSEGRGVRPDILRSSKHIAIPMAQSVESMNVAAAGSMLMFALSQNAFQGVLNQISVHLKHSELVKPVHRA